MASEAETLISISCTCESGCIVCSHAGVVEALSVPHQFVAGWRGVTFDPVDTAGNVQVYLTNREGHSQKGLLLAEAELRALIHHGAAHFDRVDRAAR